MKKMHDRYDYFKALLDFRNMLERHEDSFLKSKKKYKTFVMSFLDIMLRNPTLLDEFMVYGGDTRYLSDELLIKPNGEVFIKDGDKT